MAASKAHPVPFWFFLLAAQFLDVLMVTFVTLGIETMEPEDSFSVPFSGFQTNMFLSHDLLPVLGWTAVFGVAAWLIWRKPVIALWCAGLVLFHEVCDLVVGFPHDVIRGVGPVGMALYVEAPISAFLIEAAMAGAIVFWFCHRRARAEQPVSTGTKVALYGLLVGTTLATLPLANNSINSLLGL